MILITPTIKDDYPEAFRIARKDKMRVVWLEDDLAYCARRKKGHGQYIVQFFAIPQVSGGRQVKIQCRSITGARCHKMQFNELCAHAAKVILLGQARINRKQRLKAA